MRTCATYSERQTDTLCTYCCDSCAAGESSGCNTLSTNEVSLYAKAMKVVLALWTRTGYFLGCTTLHLEVRKATNEQRMIGRTDLRKSIE